MSSIKIEEIRMARLAADRLANCEERVNTGVTTLENIFDTMKANGWKGNTSTTFYSNYETYHAQMEALKSQINEVYTAMNSSINNAQKIIDAGETTV